MSYHYKNDMFLNLEILYQYQLLPANIFSLKTVNNSDKKKFNRDNLVLVSKILNNDLLITNNYNIYLYDIKFL